MSRTEIAALRPRRVSTFLLLAGIAASTMLLLLAPPADAGAIEGVAWPTRRITYFHDATKGTRGPVAKAIKAWNTSGANIKFVAVPRSQAKVIISHPRSEVFCGGQATLGYGGYYGNFVHVARLSHKGNLFGCDPPSLTRVTAHELGHTLGLGHLGSGCTVMRPVTSPWTPPGCGSGLRDPWQYRCRSVELTDIRNAIRRYGGKPNPSQPAICDAYKRIAEPSDFDVTKTTPATGTSSDGFDGGAVTLQMRRPPSRNIPKWVPVGRRPERVEVTLSRNDCSNFKNPMQIPWNVGAGDVRSITIDLLRTGTWCVKARALDGAGRPSGYTRAIQFTIELEGEPPPGEEPPGEEPPPGEEEPPPDETDPAVAPSNDDFASAVTLDAMDNYFSAETTAATLEAGERTPSCATPARTTWYRYVANATEPVEVFLYASSWPTDPTVAVYRGSSVSDLVEVACSQGVDGYGTEMSFTTTPGAVYWIQVSDPNSGTTFVDIELWE